ncbi:restriction endonuclease subunit S [Burkholderia cenocepacia]|uniref:restriction endonuclease subunit S n=1 Tax=Burkholderia cenocepacia TaxID=95486 RepID=UPI002AAF7E3D|nr:restriction endonuclease subunit S [Burkholderia cenocepacia]
MKFRDLTNSDIKSIEDVPLGWTVRRVKDLVVDMQRGVQPQYAEGTGFYIANQACLATYSFRPEKRKQCYPLSGKKGRYKVNDILLASTGEGVLGRCVLADHDGFADSHVSIIRLKHTCTAHFLNYLLSVRYEEINARYAKGSTKQTELQRDGFLAHVLALPPLEVQKRIVTWLDQQTHRIDKRLRLIDRKRQLLEALKKSVIEESTFGRIAQDTVTRGPDISWPDAKAAHWEITRLGSLFREVADAGVEGLPMLSVSIHSGISDKELGDDELERKVNRSEDRTVYKKVKPGDLVYNQMRAWQGAFGAAKIEGLVSPAYVVARPKRGVIPEFIEYLLRAPAAMEEIRRRSRGITDFRLRLYWNEFKNIRVALPTRSEQENIVTFLDRELSKIDEQVACIDKLEALLEEQRKTIIHEAVTGKIDLSQYAVPALAA